MFEKYTARIRAYFKPTEERVDAALQFPTAQTGPALVSSATTNDNRGNQFTGYASQVFEGWARWRNQAQYGNEIVRLVIKFRSGLIAGNGATLTAEGKEGEFLETFLEANPFGDKLLNRSIRGAEIEGQVLFLIKPDVIETDSGEEKTIVVRYLPWERWRYDVVTDPDDSEKVTGITFKDAKDKDTALTPDQFVYFVTEDSEDSKNPISPIGTILTEAINMGKSKADWRSMNHIWGALGAYFEAPDLQSGQLMIKEIARMEAAGGLKVGNTMAGPAKMMFPEPSGNGQESISKELDSSARIVSGTTGVPIHHFGWAKEMSNRATAEELIDSVVAHTAPQRQAFTMGLRDVVRKSFRMWNKLNQGSLKSEKVSVGLAQVSRQQIKDLMEVWAPLNEGGFVSKVAVRQRIPDYDMKEDDKNMEEEDQEGLERQAQMIQTMREQGDEDPEEPEEVEPEQEVPAA